MNLYFYKLDRDFEKRYNKISGFVYKSCLKFRRTKCYLLELKEFSGPKLQCLHPMHKLL